MATGPTAVLFSAGLDSAVLAAAERGWPAVELAFKPHFVYAIRELASRLASRRTHPNASSVRAILRRNIPSMQALAIEEISHYRYASGPHAGFAFSIREWLDAAMRDLAE